MCRPPMIFLLKLSNFRKRGIIMETKENKTKVQEPAESKTKPMMYDLGVSWPAREEILKAFEEEPKDYTQPKK